MRKMRKYLKAANFNTKFVEFYKNSAVFYKKLGNFFKTLLFIKNLGNINFEWKIHTIKNLTFICPHFKLWKQDKL